MSVARADRTHPLEFLGLNLGWLHAALPLPAMVIATLLAAVIGLALQLTGVITGPSVEEEEDGAEGTESPARPKRKLRRTRIPFGPFLAAGTYLAYLVENPVIDAWLGTS